MIPNSTAFAAVFIILKTFNKQQRSAVLICRLSLALPWLRPRPVNRGGRGEGGVSPTLFQKLGKNALILGKNALIALLYGLNFLFKMQFLRVSRKKPGNFPAGQNLFLVLYMIVYQSALIPRKFPCPKKFPVTHLRPLS